jgi:hypothetical protein
VVIWLVYLAVRLDRSVRDRLVGDKLRAPGAFNGGDLTGLIELLDPAAEGHAMDGVQIEPCRSRHQSLPVKS